MNSSAHPAARRIITPAAFVPVELPSQTATSPGSPWPWRTVLLMAAVAAAALVLLMLLPRWAPPPAATTTGARPAIASPATVAHAGDETPTTAAIADDDKTTTARRSAQILLKAALARVAQLEAIKADRWDRSGVHHLEEQLSLGEKAYSEQRFRAAQDAYRNALVRAAEVEAKLPAVIARLLANGDSALTQGNSAAADAAFAEVLAIQPDHRAASAGRARAATLDRVRALVEQAEAYEQMGDEAKAREVYNDAARLDAKMAGVQAGLARLDAAARAAQLRAALSEGHRALERGDYAGARASFKRAATLDAQSAEVGAALRETDRRATAASIASALERAGRAQRDEAWQDAARAYGAALALDPELGDAAERKREAESRAALDAQLSSASQDLAALADAPARDVAQATLKRARAIAPAGPRLRAQMAALDTALRVAREPLKVTLVSDGETEVSVTGVGALGRFSEHQVTLAPGRHAAVLRRDGQGEQRMEFVILAGASAPRVLLKSAP